MTERNPIPACLSHLEQFRQATIWRADEVCDIPAPTGGGVYSQGWIAARETARRAIRALLFDHAADHLEALRQTPSGREAQEPEPRKLCRDCKWCRDPGVAQSACMHHMASQPATNVVTGEDGQAPFYCINMRLAMGAPCGIEARLFETRENRA